MELSADGRDESSAVSDPAVYLGWKDNSIIKEQWRKRSWYCCTCMHLKHTRLIYTLLTIHFKSDLDNIPMLHCRFFESVILIEMFLMFYCLFDIWVNIKIHIQNIVRKMSFIEVYFKFHTVAYMVKSSKQKLNYVNYNSSDSLFTIQDVYAKISHPGWHDYRQEIWFMVN